MQPVDDKGEGGPDAHGVSTTLPLNGDTSCIARARHHAADFLARARTHQDSPVPARVVDLTQLVVSELVTNACVHAPGPALLELRVTDATVEVSVQDSLPLRPAGRSTDPGRIGQHGLEIIKAIAACFQVHLGPCGKRVTAHIALTG